MIKLGVLGSTNGTDLQAILNAIDQKLIKASVSIVISNKKNAYILERAKKQVKKIATFRLNEINKK